MPEEPEGIFRLADFDRYKANEKAFIDSFKRDAFVAVFKLSTHNGKSSLSEDALHKVDSMFAGGVRKFEFLLRGDETMKLDQYVDQTLAAINELSKKYPDAQFGVGTVSSPEMMEKVAKNPNIKFIVTAHWPGEAMIKTARDNGKAIIPTVSCSDHVEVKTVKDGETAEPGKERINELDPEHIATLRESGIYTFKAFDFKKISDTRAYMASQTDGVSSAAAASGDITGAAAAVAKSFDDPLTSSAYGLIAIAEAISESYRGKPIPENQRFFAMATGGVTLENLPYIAAGTKHPKMREKIRDLLRKEDQELNSNAIMGILDNTIIGAGGTFITKEYDKVADQTDDSATLMAASSTLRELSDNVFQAAKWASMGKIRDTATVAVSP